MGKRPVGQLQKVAMERLKQQAAAWLIDLPASTLRDQPDVPRNLDGSYNARELVAWARSRVSRPVLDNEDLERLLIAAQELFLRIHESETASVLCELFEHVTGKYGEFGLVFLAEAVVSNFREYAAELDGYDPEDPEVARQAELQQQREEERDAAHRHLRICIVCEKCQHRRVGRTWIKAGVPKGFTALLDYCPKCDPTSG